MKEQIVSKAYAKSLVDLAEEAKIDLASEMTKLTEVINKSNHLENLLFLDVFTIEEKTAVASEVLAKIGVSTLVKNFVLFLIQEKRIGLLPMIFKDIIVIDDHRRGFLRGTIEGGEETVSNDVLEKMKKFLKEKLNKEVTLSYVKSDNVTAGYRVTVEDLQLDASLEEQLEKFKTSVLNA